MRRFGWPWHALGETNALGAILTRNGRIGEWSHPTVGLHDEDVTSVTSELQAVHKVGQVV